MNAESAIRGTLDQAYASWITYLNQLRIDTLLDKLSRQDINLENALVQLEYLKKSIAEEIIKTNRGGSKGIHGFIGERMQVGIENAKKLIDGLNKEYVLIDDNGPVDYLKNGVPIQQKARQLNLGIDAIREHLKKYPDFLKNGGKYEIPKDYYEKLQKLWDLSSEEAKKIQNSQSGDYKLWKAIQSFKKQTDISLDKIAPMDADYSEIQKNTYEDAIDRREREIRKKDQANRDAAYQKSKPTIEEAGKAVKIGAGMEGGISLCLAIAKKHKEGKRLCEYTEKDWMDVGIDTGKGTVKGGIRGGVVYVMSNFTCTPSNVASALVTAIFGTVANAMKLSKGEISQEDFVINSEACCLDAGVSAISGIIGEIIIPIPVLGAIIGTSVTHFMYGIIQKYCNEDANKCIEGYRAEINALNKKLEKKYLDFIELLEREFKKYATILELAFDDNINKAFENSILLAQMSGVEEYKILKTKVDIDNFFLA